MNGLAIGLAQLTLSTYVSELAPVQLRGFLLVSYSFWWGFGQLIAAVATFIIEQQPNKPRLYLDVIYSEWIFSGLSLIIIVLIPESPCWYIAKGKRDKAVKVLQRMNGKIPGYDAEHETTVLEYDLAGQRSLQEEAQKLSYFDLFRGVNLVRTQNSHLCHSTDGPSAELSFHSPLWAGSSVSVLQLSSDTTLVSCTRSAHRSRANSTPQSSSRLLDSKTPSSVPFAFRKHWRLLSKLILLRIILLVTVFCSGWGVDRFGRRPLLLVGGTLIVILLVVIGSLAFLKVTPAVGGATVAVMCLWVV